MRRTSGYIDVNPNITVGVALRQMIVHEVGHFFGLDDCPTCTRSATVMADATSMNDTGGLNLPAGCDITKVNTYYAGPTCSDYLYPDSSGSCPTGYEMDSSGFCCPTPMPGGCLGAEDWLNYPQTGCAYGFMNIGGTCGRSDYFVDYCNSFGGGYDSYQCTCSDALGACTAPPGGCLGGLRWDEQTCDCSPDHTPVLVDVEGDGFRMTNAYDGVDFDITADGVPERLSWSAAGTDDAWLALDRNGNGSIDDGSELFGNYTPQPMSSEKNGFLALAEYDKPASGGNNDGKIDLSDSIFANLRLWQDANHNGVSEPSELITLPNVGIVSIDLDYRESGREDDFGNRFKYRAKVTTTQRPNSGRWAWDVVLRSYGPAAQATSSLIERYRTYQPIRPSCSYKRIA